MPTTQPTKVEPGRVTFTEGRGEMPMLQVSTHWSTAEVYLHGAHVTHFRKREEPPLLFLSQCSRFAAHEPIRGGIPVIFPWFGPRGCFPQHGFARLKTWELKEVIPASDGSVSLRLCFPPVPEAASFPPWGVEYIITVSDSLSLRLEITNLSKSTPFSFENCLHTYFEVGDVSAISVKGLKGTSYLDKVENFARKAEKNDAIEISSEIDRVYLETTGPVSIEDRSQNRIISVEKEGSASTVVWNPWITKAQNMSDFGNDEYQRMVCVESGNVGDQKVELPPGETSVLKVTISSQPMAAAKS